jgi:hypothetical protein
MAKANSVIRPQGILFRTCDQPISSPVCFRPIACPEKNGRRGDRTDTKRDGMVERVRPMECLRCNRYRAAGTALAKVNELK